MAVVGFIVPLHLHIKTIYNDMAVQYSSNIIKKTNK